jgi:hypothetical protein
MTRVTGPKGETIHDVYYPPRLLLTLGPEGQVISWRPATTFETTRAQIRALVTRLFPSPQRT